MAHAVNGTGVRGTEPILVRFDRRSSTDAAKQEMEQQGLRPADLTELLALGADPHYRDLQRQFPIVELASVWSGRVGGRGVVGLCGGADGRSLSLSRREFDWAAGYRFLAFRKS